MFSDAPHCAVRFNEFHVDRTKKGENVNGSGK